MDFQDDGFEGSANEHIIFKEVFFGNAFNLSNKRRPLNKASSYEHETCKINDASFCSSSEISTMTSYSNSRNINLDECNNTIENLRNDSARNGLPCRCSSMEDNDENASAKRMKFSTDEPSNSAPDLGKVMNSSELITEPTSASYNPAEDCDFKSFTFHVVESSSHGIISSCCLLKHLVEQDSNLGNVLKHPSKNVEDNDGADMAMITVSASPVSQESSMTRLLVSSPSVTLSEKSESPLHLEVGQTGFQCPKMDTSLKTDLMRDPRPLLHYHVVHLLIAAGWSIENRKRPSRRHMETVYRSPQGRIIREFPKAWRFCGELLFTDRGSFVKEVNNKEWSGIHKFLLDLSDTLLHVGKEMNQLGATSSLAHCWGILDPYVVVVFVDRKIGALRKGDIVKATPSLGTNRTNRTDSTNADSVGNLFAEKNAPALHDHSSSAKSVLSETVLKDLNGGYSAFGEQTCDTSFSKHCGHTEEGTVKFLSGASNCVPNVGTTPSGMGNHCNEPGNKIGMDDLTSFPTYWPGTSCKQSFSCLPDGPVPSGNSDNVIRVSGYVSPEQGSTLYLSCEQSSENQIEKPNGMVQNVLMSSLGKEKQVGVPSDDKVENNMQESLNDCSNYTSDDLSHSFASGIVEKSTQNEEEGGLLLKDSKFDTEYKITAAHSVLKKKVRRKCKKISEINPTLPQKIDVVSVAPGEKTEFWDIDGNCSQLDMKEGQKSQIDDAKYKDSHEKGLSLSPMSHHSERKGSKFKKIYDSLRGSKTREKELSECQIEDDDLLVSAIIKNKEFSSSAARFFPKRKFWKSRAKKKRKSYKSSCRLLLRSLGNGEKNYEDGKWYITGARTVLSWLLNAGVVSSNDIIQYQNPKDSSVVKHGRITGDGIICNCCNKLLSLAKFKSHAGFKLNRPCLNLFLDSGKPFMLCQLQAWSTEYKTRRSGATVVQVDEDDRNDDSCGHCGDGGELICCDNCPSTFHHSCLSIQELPEGNWYCLNCTCQICGDLVTYEEASSSFDALKCSQCEQKYHKPCVKQKDINPGVGSDIWFCSGSCRKAYTGLQSQVGLINQSADGYSWIVLRCIHYDQKILSTQRLAMMAECNSRLVVALTIMEECFLSMVDPRTGIDMIPHVVYNWKSSFPRLDFHGFYTVILEKDDVLLSVASIRVHGSTVAEMPLIATCSKYRRQGMCRRLLNAIEEMLLNFKVKMLVIAAIPSLVETWTEGFGFIPVEDDEKQCLRRFNLMVFPGTVLLKKSLYLSGQMSEKTGVFEMNGSTKAGMHSGVMIDAETKQQCDRHSCPNEACPRTEMECLEYQELPKPDGRRIMNNLEENQAQIDSSALKLVESNEVDVSLGQKSIIQSVSQSDGNSCTNKVGVTTEARTHEGK